MTFIDFFNMYVSSKPDHPALVDEAGTLTYSQLDAEAELLVRKYSSQGIGAGDAVCVKVPYGKDIMVHAIAIHKLGAVYVPVDDGYPEDRVRYIREDCTRQKFDPDVSMIIYTSGTTGRPKGVVHTHKSLMAIVRWLVPETLKEWSMHPITRCGIVTGVSFLGTNILMFSTLATGGTLYFANEMERLDTNALYGFLRRNGITHIFMSSFLGKAMVENYDTTGTLIMVGGEKLNGFRSKAGQSLLNIYGSTEGAVVCDTFVDGMESVIPVGMPCPGVTVRIVDDGLNEVEPGEVGELIYSADIMAREYLHLPEQTAAKWILLDGVRWFRTGDRARQNPDGNIYVLGRTDNMVKVRGFRVETGEVERQIAFSAPDTEIAVVLRRLHGIDHLVCFYQSAVELDVTRVKDDISRTLAEYMIPDIWVRLDRFPRNDNGKIMRKDLHVPDTSKFGLSIIYNEVEMHIKDTATLVLGSPVSLDDNFFENGGTSISAIKLASMLKCQGIHVTGSQIMQLKVLRKVAAEAQVDYEKMWDPEQWQDIRESFSSRGMTIEKVLPLSPENEDMLIEYIMQPDSTVHRAVYMLEMDSHVDTSVLNSVIGSVARQHEYMRACTVIHHHYPFQVVIVDKFPDPDLYVLEKDGWLGLKDIYSKLMNTMYDPEYDNPIRLAYVDIPDSGSFLFVVTYDDRQSLSLARNVLADIMGQLLEYYPADVSIRDWHEFLKKNIGKVIEPGFGMPESGETSGPEPPKLSLSRLQAMQTDRLIRTFSPLREGKPSVTFVHTGNTGSDAYYRLADKIGDSCAFSVIEPYNLFHVDDIQYGIKAIASKYIEILRDYQPEGPYILGGWCYGGVVAHEMACQLQARGETVSHLIMFDSHALYSNIQGSGNLATMAESMFGTINSDYFETSPLFEDMREQGLLEAMVHNFRQVKHDMLCHIPSVFHGPVTYFKPLQTPIAAHGETLQYWKRMMEFDAGNFENFCDRDRLRIYNTPHEHDLMMDDESLSITVPILKQILGDEA